jgi:hypothetical protein
MASFDDRERHEEARFKHQQEQAFKVRNRRNRLLGEWAAEQLGHTGEAVTAYAKEVVMADFDRPGDDDVIEKVKADLQAGGIEISDHLLKKRLGEFEATAAAQIKAQ